MSQTTIYFVAFTAQSLFYCGIIHYKTRWTNNANGRTKTGEQVFIYVHGVLSRDLPLNRECARAFNPQAKLKSQPELYEAIAPNEVRSLRFCSIQ